MVWEKALDVIQADVDENGFFLWDRSFMDFVRKYNIPASMKTSFYLSLDFYSQQRPELTERGLYVIRLGRGNFGIFDQSRYPKPYLELDEEGCVPFSLIDDGRFVAVKKAFRVIDEDLLAAEDTLLELCRIYGVFKNIADYLGVDEYQVGPRGLFSSNFPVFFKKNDGGFSRFDYDGQVELDYSLWTEDRVLVFEAKSLTSGGLDIGWHKMAFPSQRFGSFLNDGFKINPVYFLRKRDSRGNRILVYLFPEIHFEEGGIVLNDAACWRPIKVWSIDLGKLR